MLGVKTTTDSVSRFNASRLAPNIGLEKPKVSSFRVQVSSGNTGNQKLDAGN
jgi:hypothetical protein